MMIIAIIIVLIMILFILYTNSIPKIIWTFWNTEELPEIIEKCIESWKVQNKNYEIIILNPKNLDKYLGDGATMNLLQWKFNDCHQKFSDLVRLNILAKYGGVWMDASIVCYQNIDNVIPNEHRCTVYSIPELSQEPLIESWFIACNRSDMFVKKWRDEFMRVCDYDTIDDYVRDINVDMTGIKYPDYLLIYLCARKVLRELPGSLNILNATTGPYIYHTRGGVKSLCSKRPDKILKLRKEDRAEVLKDQTVFKCIFDN